MNQNFVKHLIIVCTGIFFFACSNNTQAPEPYFGQTPPEKESVLFAPGIVNDGIATRDITFTPDRKEMYFGKNIGNSTYSTILFCKQTESGWTNPEVVSFAQDPDYIFIEPHISPDGQKLFFVSNMGNDFTAGNRFITDIWVAQREGDNWGTPTKLDTTVNSKNPEFYPTVTENGTLYFTREDSETRQNFIYKSEFKDGKYQTPILLPEQVNCGRTRFNTTIAPDESFMIIPCIGMPDSYGGTDYYISFYDETKGWSEPQNMGPEVNTPTTHQYSTSFSPDGKYLFFMSTRTNTEGIEKLDYATMQKMNNSPESGNSNIYWIESDLIDDLKQKAIFKTNE